MTTKTKDLQILFRSLCCYCTFDFIFPQKQSGTVRACFTCFGIILYICKASVLRYFGTEVLTTVYLTGSYDQCSYLLMYQLSKQIEMQEAVHRCFLLDTQLWVPDCQNLSTTSSFLIWCINFADIGVRISKSSDRYLK